MDYNETYSPLVRIQFVRSIIATSAQHDYHLHQMDVETTDMNAMLKEVVYMTIPQGVVIPKHLTHQENFVCCVLRSIHGLKKSAMEWLFVIFIGFIKSQVDDNVYLIHKDFGFALLATYVDGILLSSISLPLLHLLNLP